MNHFFANTTTTTIIRKVFFYSCTMPKRGKKLWNLLHQPFILCVLYERFICIYSKKIWKSVSIEGERKPSQEQVLLHVIKLIKTIFHSIILEMTYSSPNLQAHLYHFLIKFGHLFIFFTRIQGNISR